MDFLKKAQKKMKEMMEDDDRPKQHSSLGDHDRGFGESQSYSQQQQHGYGEPPPPQSQYGQSRPPQLPPGWSAQWDQNSDRYYFLEQATGRTQWDMPAFSPHGQYGAPSYGASGHEERGMSGDHGNQQGYEAPGGYGFQKRKDKSHGGALAAGAGGLAVGALGGAVIAHDMTEDSDEDRRANMGAAPVAAPYGAPAGDPYAAQMPPAPPNETASGSSVSSSDQEEIEERRKSLEEAQEDYNEAVEEGYDD